MIHLLYQLSYTAARPLQALRESSRRSLVDVKGTVLTLSAGRNYRSDIPLRGLGHARPGRRWVRDEEEEEMRVAAWVPVVGLALSMGYSGIANAQETPSAPPTGAIEPAPKSKTVFQSLKTFGSFGMNAGGMLFILDKDARRDAQIRPSLQSSFRYRFSDQLVGVAEFGYGWNAYRDRGDTVLAVTSGTLGLYKHMSDAIGLDWKFGGGAGFYRWNYKFNGNSLRDPQTDLLYRGIVPGVFVGLEAERRLTAHVTLLATGQTHYLFSGNKSDFPTAFGGSDAYLTMRVGVNYHFSPYEGILWERKVKRTIRLQSGKAGS